MGANGQQPGWQGGDGVSREEARVNVDLVVLEPAQANGMAQPSDQDVENGRGGDDKKEVEKEELNAHRGFVDMFKELEAAGAVLGQTVGDAVHAVEDAGKTVGEQMGDATNALATNLNAITTMFNDDAKSEGIGVAQSKMHKRLGLFKGPTIILKAIDCMQGAPMAKDIVVDWDDAFEDVLKKLCEEFGRDVIFDYELHGRVMRVQDDQGFDRAMAVAERGGNILYVVIQQAVWSTKHVEEVEPEEPEPEEAPLLVTCADRMSYSPAPYKLLLGIGSVGSIVALATSVAGFTSVANDQGTYLGALSISIPLPYFLHGWTVKNSQTLAPTIVKCAVAFAGAIMGIFTMVSYAQLQYYDGLVAAVLWIFATSFYLWVSYPLILKYIDLFLHPPPKKRQRKKRKKSAGAKLAEGVEHVKAFLLEWGWLIIYMCAYGIIQYTPLQHASKLVSMKASYQPEGAFYARGDGQSNHMVCKGFTDVTLPVDNRPVVILESMEVLGQALAMTAVHEALARVGIVCAYDRAGFGWSPRNLQQSRTPNIIAQELHHMLTKNEVMVNIPPREGETVGNRTRVVPGDLGFVMVGHSLGSVYARRFAHLYPKLTSALVMWDAIPSQNTGPDKNEAKMQPSVFSSSKVTSFMLDICAKYLEPMGLIDLFMQPTLIDPVFNGTFLGQEYPIGIGQALDRMKSRMLFRDWCPSVMAEYADMYTGGSPGIFQVVDSDLAGYQMPMTVWSRGYSVYQGKLATEEKYMINTKDACSKDITEIADNATDHPEGTSGWQCIQFAVLNYAFLPYKNPQKRTCEVRGQPQLGKTNPCPDIQRSKVNGTELAPLQGPTVVAELVDTVLDAWAMLKWSTKYPSNPFAIQMQGFSPGLCFTGGCTTPVADWRAKFIVDMMAVLGPRLANEVQIEVMEGPASCGLYSIAKPTIVGQLTGIDCPVVSCTSLTTCATPWSKPSARRKEGAGGGGVKDRQEGLKDNLLSGGGRRSRGGLGGLDDQHDRRAFAEVSFYVVFRIIGATNVKVQNAVDILQCIARADCANAPLGADAPGTSSITIATRGAEYDRRYALLRSYNITSIVNSTRDATLNQWNTSQLPIVVECPSNTYRTAGICKQCPINSTAPSASFEQTACRCDPNFYLNVIGEDWNCLKCPDNSKSPCGSLRLTDCVCNPGFVGPNGGPCTPCPVNTYKAISGNHNCTSCNASSALCDSSVDLSDCHHVSVSTAGADPTLAQVDHPTLGSGIVMKGKRFGTNCTLASPTIDACVAPVVGVETSGTTFPDQTLEWCMRPELQAGITPYPLESGESLIMQRCISSNVFGCRVYANVSLVTWPATTRCKQCDPGVPGSSQCCLVDHLVRPCFPGNFPGGSPAHCTEVSALTMRDLGQIFICAKGNSTRR